MVTKKKKAKSKALVKRKKFDKELVWAGGKRMMGSANGEKEKKERQMILLASKVLDVSPYGVNILGSVPYINKLGLHQKANQYEPGVRFVYDWITTSENDDDKAICSCKVVDKKGKDLTDFVIGECSPSSMKMGTLKGYQNHMAQTRARNRAILEAFGVRIHEEMMANIEKLSRKQKISDDQVESIGDVVATSVEEVNTKPPFSQKKVETKNGELPKNLYEVIDQRIDTEEDENKLWIMRSKLRKRKSDKLLSQTAIDKLCDKIQDKLGVPNENL